MVERNRLPANQTLVSDWIVTQEPLCVRYVDKIFQLDNEHVHTFAIYPQYSVTQYDKNVTCIHTQHTSKNMLSSLHLPIVKLLRNSIEIAGLYNGLVHLVSIKNKIPNSLKQYICSRSFLKHTSYVLAAP